MSSPFPFPEGRRCAVCLTYDDALPVHHEEVAPLLEKHGLRATFYTPADERVLDHVEVWRRVAAAGHELGNHSIFHPCRQFANGWPPDDFDLQRYSLDRLRRELRVANGILSLVDGRPQRSYGNTCHHIEVGPDDARGSIQPVIEELFVVGRGRGEQPAADPATATLWNVGCQTADGRTFEQLREEIEAARDAGRWLIYCAHGVGRDHRLLWDADEHRRTIDWLASQRETIWTAPVVDVAQHVRAQRGA